VRQHKNKEPQMRKRNWKQYNKELVQRGSLTFLIDPNLFKKQATPSSNGWPQEFPDSLITMLMMVKVYYRFTYRFLEGFARSILSLASIQGNVPSYSLICKRAEGKIFSLYFFNTAGSK
jgi:hypothetical protein